MGRRDLTRKGKGQLHPTPTYEHELLGHQLAQKRMIPFKTIVRARSFDEYHQWVRHDGEEFFDGTARRHHALYGILCAVSASGGGTASTSTVTWATP